MKLSSNIIQLFLLLFLCTATASFSQKETFDILDYTMMKGWTKQDAEGIRVFTKENEKTGAYCIISVLKSKPSAGKVEDDFRNAWKDIVVTAYKGPSKPVSEEKADAEDGWKVISGSSMIKVEGTDALSLLTVLSGEKRTFSIFALLNDESYFNLIDSFMMGIDINKAELARLNSNNSSVTLTSSDTLTISKQNSSPQSYDNFIYRVPDGWTSKQEANFMELFPQNVKPKEVFSIILLKGKTSNASLEQELAFCWDEFAGMMKAEKLREVSGGNYNVGSVSKTFAGWEYITGQGSIRTGSDFFVHAYVIRVKDRVERVIVLAQEIRLDAVRNNIDPTIHHEPYYNTITDFIFNLRFSNFNSPELKLPTWKGAGITGVWAGIGFMGGKLKTTYAIFFSNGQVFYGSRFPLEGLHELNTYVDRERTPRFWGTYTFQNGRGTVSMPSGSFPIRLESGKLVMAPISEEHKFIRMPPVDGVKLNGIWRIQGQGNEWVTIRFNEDGSFTDNGALWVLDHSVYDYYRIPDGGGSGKYIIKDHTIIFSYSDGRILKVAFPGKQFTPGNNSPTELVLSFNDDLLIKQ